MESSVTRTLTFGVGQMHRMHNQAESAVTVPQVNHVEPEIEVLICSDQKYLHEKSEVEEHKVCLQSNSVNCSDRSDILEDEVSTISFLKWKLNAVVIMTALLDLTYCDVIFKVYELLA